MGMYTDFCFDVNIKKDVPDDVVAMLNQMRDFDRFDLFQKVLPDHPFFKCDRWVQIGHCSSAYFPAEPRFIFEKKILWRRLRVESSLQSEKLRRRNQTFYQLD